MNNLIITNTNTITNNTNPTTPTTNNTNPTTPTTNNTNNQQHQQPTPVTNTQPTH